MCFLAYSLVLRTGTGTITLMHFTLQFLLTKTSTEDYNQAKVALIFSFLGLLLQVILSDATEWKSGLTRESQQSTTPLQSIGWPADTFLCFYDFFFLFFSFNCRPICFSCVLWSLVDWFLNKWMGGRVALHTEALSYGAPSRSGEQQQALQLSSVEFILTTSSRPV